MRRRRTSDNSVSVSRSVKQRRSVIERAINPRPFVPRSASFVSGGRVERDSKLRGAGVLGLVLLRMRECVLAAYSRTPSVADEKASPLWRFRASLREGASF